MGGGSGPREVCSDPAPLHTHCPMPGSDPPGPSSAQPAGTGTVCKARRTYIGRAVRRTWAAPVSSAPLPAAAVLLGRSPSAAARLGRRPAPAGPLAARLPPVVSVLGAQPGGRGHEGRQRGMPPPQKASAPRERQLPTCPVTGPGTLPFREKAAALTQATGDISIQGRGRLWVGATALPRPVPGWHQHCPGQLPTD